MRLPARLATGGVRPELHSGIHEERRIEPSKRLVFSNEEI